MYSREHTELISANGFSRDGDVLRTKLIVQRNPGAHIEVLTNIEPVTDTRSQAGDVVVTAFVRLVQFITDMGIIAVDSEEQSIQRPQREVVELDRSSAGVDGKSAVSVSPLWKLSTICPKLEAKPARRKRAGHVSGESF